MSRERIISALDIGSYTVRAASLLINPRQDFLKIIGLGQVPSRGIKRGQIIDFKEASSTITEVIDVAAKSGNVKISKLAVGLGGTHLKLMHSRGAIAVSRADGEISYDDVLRVLESAQAISLPQNREIVQTIPLEYKIDAEEKIKDPVGMRGVRLEAEVILVLASSPILKTIRKAVEQSGCLVESWLYAPLATSRAVLTKKQRELGVALVNIGSESSSLSIWEESELKNSLVLPLGSSHITNDVAIGFRVAPELAEKLKVTHGAALSGRVSRREQVVMADWGIDDAVMSRWELSRIIEARAAEIFGLIGEELKKISQPNLLPAGVVLVGGGVKLEGMIELAKKVFRLPVEIGRSKGVKSEFHEIFDAALATLVGLLLYEYEREQLRARRAGPADADITSNIWAKAKDWFSELLP